MNRTTLHLEFVTPCFCGGADTQGLAEWRSQSVRGQLRWWFRALGGRVYDGDLARLKAAEAQVLGSTDGCSSVRIETLGAPGVWEAGTPHRFGRSLTAQDLLRLWRHRPADEPEPIALDRLRIVSRRTGQEIRTNPLQYLGYGSVDLRNLVRSCIAPGQAAQLRVSWSPGRMAHIDPSTRELFGRALWAWLHLGGLGSRARNGWGSLIATRLEGEVEGVDKELFQPLDRADLRAEIANLLRDHAEYGASVDDLEWTQVSRHTEIYMGTELHDTWDEALSHAGAWLIAYRRRYGNPNELRTDAGSTLANRDYAWAAPRATLKRKGVPDRAGFGLPLPFGERGEIITWHRPAGDSEAGDPRRASPLLLHIARDGGKHFPVFTHLPSRFLPASGEVHYKGSSKPSVSPTNPQREIVHRFIADLETKNLVTRVSP